MAKLLIVDGDGLASKALQATAEVAGIDVYLAVHRPSWKGEPDSVLRDRCLYTDFARPDGFIADAARLADDIGITGVVTANEYLTPLVTLLCGALALPGNVPELAYAVRNKLVMYERFVQCGVTTPRTVEVTSEEEIEDLARRGELPAPFVVKPADHAGSNGVTVVADASLARAAFRHAKKHQATLPYGIAPDPRILVQEYMAGDEFSVESVTQSGVAHHVCITRKMTTLGAHRIELGHSIPATLAPATAGRVLEETGRALAAVGIMNGVSHTEVMLDKSGRCAVIETAARIPGVPIGDLVELAVGVDLCLAAATIALGRNVRVARGRDRYATARFLVSDRRGRLARISGLPEVGPTVPVVHLKRKVGDLVGGMASNRDRVGHFIVTGANGPCVEAEAEYRLSKVSLEVCHGPDARACVGMKGGTS